MVKLIISAIFSFVVLNCFSQDGKVKSRINVTAGSFFLTDTKIESEESGKILEYYKTPGVKLGINYTIEKKHIFFISGIGVKILPVGFKVNLKTKDIITYQGKFENDLIKVSEYVFHTFSVPLNIGYQTIENKAGQKFWISSGLEINGAPYRSTRIVYSHDFIIPPNIYYETQSIVTTYLSFNLSSGITIPTKNGCQVKFGLDYNKSYNNIIEGVYEVNLKNQTINGTYTETGSYAGFSIAYAFKAK